MQIFFSYYQMPRKFRANARTDLTFQSSSQKGALVKVVDEFGHFGVADLCPWPSLGDADLQTEILQKGPLYQRALELAQLDLQARKEKRQLVDAKAVDNHSLINDFTQPMVLQNTQIYKVKGTKDYQALAAWLNGSVQNVYRVRLDFNSCLSSEEFESFLNLLNAETIQKIEVVEDPFPFDLKKWAELDNKVSLAADFEKGHWPKKINKPSRAEFVPDSLYLTSSMDHPVGLVHGLHYAQKMIEKIHGFLTLDQYRTTLYHTYFQTSGSKLVYQSSGWGVGFDAELAQENWAPLIEWKIQGPTILVFNPTVTDLEKEKLFQIKNDFLEIHPQDFVLIPSSGSSGELKVFAFEKQSLLNSARRVNSEFQLTGSMNWGCVLPLFHVGGLGILVRAYLSGAQVFFSSWKNFNVDWIVENDIQLLSLVPAQIHDLVKNNISAPKQLKYIFVGGGHLDETLYQMALQLGWPLVLTYGMTETAAMISRRNAQGFFELFEGVTIQEQGEDFYIQCDSLASYQLHFENGMVRKIPLRVNPRGVLLPDVIEIESANQFKILGRRDDQIKIKGELVNLNKIRRLLPAENYEVFAVHDLRNGHRLVLVGEKQSLAEVRQIAINLNARLHKYEKVDLVAATQLFPRSALNKIKQSELKRLVEKENKYEAL